MPNNIKQKLIIMADTVRAQVLYELKLNFDTAEFYKLKFLNQQYENAKICKVIFKQNI